MYRIPNWSAAKLTLVALALIFLSPTGAVHAQERVIHTFCTHPLCPDGQNPAAALTVNASHDIFGTTQGGGRFGYGAVFMLAPTGKEKVLYSFCSKPYCVDGTSPQSNLIEDSSGNLYGTASAGGAGTGCEYSDGCGTIFKIDPAGVETVLHSFCSEPRCVDGGSPTSAIVADTSGNLYGATLEGGKTACGDYGCGTVFKIAPDGSETVLHSFSGGTDGSYPNGNLIMDKHGILYGTTGGSGGNNIGTVFRLARNGTLTMLAGLGCNLNGCARTSPGSLVRDRDGNLYWAMPYGGSHNGGVIEKRAPNGSASTLYNFCAQANCSDGSYPIGLFIDGQGNLFGTTYFGGGNITSTFPHGAGTVFELSPNGTETVLHAFCGQANCSDGAAPIAGVSSDGRGYLVGTTDSGGSTNCQPAGCGVAFKIVR